MNELRSEFTVSQRRACRVIDQPRQTQRYQSRIRDDEPQLIREILDLVRKFPRYGYRMITGKLRGLGWKVNFKRVYRIWKQEGLKVPVKKRKKRRLGNSRNASHRQRAEHPNHVWSWDFIFDRTVMGKPLKWLTIIDEFTRENLCLEVGYGMTSEQVIDHLAALCKSRGLPKFTRSDNGPEYISDLLATWSDKHGITLDFIQPGNPQQNAYIERYNRTVRYDWLEQYLWTEIYEVQDYATKWLWTYNHERPNMALGGITPIQRLAMAA